MPLPPLVRRDEAGSTKDMQFRVGGERLYEQVSASVVRSLVCQLIYHELILQQARLDRVDHIAKGSHPHKENDNIDFRPAAFCRNVGYISFLTFHDD